MHTYIHMYTLCSSNTAEFSKCIFASARFVLRVTLLILPYKSTRRYIQPNAHACHTLLQARGSACVRRCWMLLPYKPTCTYIYSRQHTHAVHFASARFGLRAALRGTLPYMYTPTVKYTHMPYISPAPDSACVQRCSYMHIHTVKYTHMPYIFAGARFGLRAALLDVLPYKPDMNSFNPIAAGRSSILQTTIAGLLQWADSTCVLRWQQMYCRQRPEFEPPGWHMSLGEIRKRVSRLLDKAEVHVIRCVFVSKWPI
jgi:hypothetical protein